MTAQRGRAATGRQGRHQSSRTGITSDCIANQFLHRLKLHGVQPGRIVPFATCRSILGGFRVSKEQSWELYRYLERAGRVQVVPFTGLKVIA